MSRSVVGKWRKNLAIRVPMEIARATGLMDGERVEVETLDGDIFVRRREARMRARRDADAALRSRRKRRRRPRIYRMEDGATLGAGARFLPARPRQSPWQARR